VTGSAQAKIDAAQNDVTACADAMTRDDPAAIRAACLPVLVRVAE
jgi:hypothetical protein